MKSETAVPSDGTWLPGRAALATGLSGAPGENVALKPAIRPKGASQKGPWGTTYEVVINSVTCNRRKGSWRHQSWWRTPEPKRQAARREHSAVALSSPVARPEDSHPLKVRSNVSLVEPVKPVVPCPSRGSSQSASNGDGIAGKGCRRKRMPPRSGVDRAAPARKGREYPPRKGADFRPVCNGGKSLNGIPLGQRCQAACGNRAGSRPKGAGSEACPAK